MNLQLNNKVIIVTGGAKGIGEGICKVLADEGAIPVVVGRKAADNQAVVSAITAAGGKAFQVVAELSDPQECKKAVEEVVAHFGRIDGLVNNAGVNDGVGLENGTYEAFMASLHKNVVHYYLMAHYALPELKKIKRIYFKHHLKNCRNRSGKYIRLRSRQWRAQCPNTRVGGRIIEIWHPCKCYCGGRVLDTCLRYLDKRFG